MVAALRAAGCVWAEDEARLILAAAATPDELGELVDRRMGGLPLEQVLGWAEFCGLRIAVDRGVFVPRPRTELMVREAVARAVPAAPVVVDLCCGSGAVGLAVIAKLGGGELHAVDIDPAAVGCAHRNVVEAGVGSVYAGDLYEPLPEGLRGRVDVLLANAPYVPSEAIGLLPREAREYEPRVALDGGADGLDIQRRVAAGASDWLAPGGQLLGETSVDQAPRAVADYARGGLSTRVARWEELEATAVVGTAPAQRSQDPTS